MTADPPTSLRGGRYRILAELGRGGQGATFEASDETRRETVAIKQFRVRGASSWKEVELAEREAKVLGSLSHPLLPKYLDHFEEDGALYLVTEKVDGKSLAALVASGDRFEQRDAIRLLEDLSEILGYLHRQSPPVIHRDIKPANVIRRRDGRFMLVDFGAVRDHLRPEGGSTVVGTFGYMAPEQFQGRAMAATDVYGAAATALWMLTGVEPEKLPHRGLGIDVASALPRDTDPALGRLLAAALLPDPDQRAMRLAPLLDAARRSVAADRGRSPESKRRGAPDSSRRRGPESKRDKKERKRREKERRRKEKEHTRDREGGRARRHGRARRPFPGLSGPVLSVVLIALILAQIAVTIALCALVPAVLHALAPLTDPSLKVAAKKSWNAGRQASAAIDRAKSYVRGSQPDRPIDPGTEHTSTDRDGRGARIADDEISDLDVDAASASASEAEAEAWAEAEEEAERAAAAEAKRRAKRQS